jgi:hypothetical protein
MIQTRHVYMPTALSNMERRRRRRPRFVGYFSLVSLRGSTKVQRDTLHRGLRSLVACRVTMYHSRLDLSPKRIPLEKSRLMAMPAWIRFKVVRPSISPGLSNNCPLPTQNLPRTPIRQPILDRMNLPIQVTMSPTQPLPSQGYRLGWSISSNESKQGMKWTDSLVGTQPLSGICLANWLVNSSEWYSSRVRVL